MSETPTPDVSERAREEAERRYPADQSAPYRIRPAMLDAFAAGAAWAEKFADASQDGAR